MAILQARTLAPTWAVGRHIMKSDMKCYFLLSFSFLAISCSFEKSAELPTKMLINEVILNIVSEDSAMLKARIFYKIRDNYIYYPANRPDSIPPPPPPPVPFSISFNELSEDTNVLRKSIHRLKDSIFILKQVNSIKNTELDSIPSMNVRLIKELPKEESYYRFYNPIFSADLKRAFIQYCLCHGRCFEDCYIIQLKKTTSGWVKVKSRLKGYKEC